ncbi:MBL fold metallo-hydrolase [Halorubrum sp. CBA1125]|uniref:MBL fold metallo-hydrolase n=1 Tax=Halorubrum sp. CBA1125 TaxID=2668072 RepID=UPI0012E8C30F|nr:MBL fold metallo-hydrolase [Halorubrum sp. CBA1125]MUW13371.1 MBL fold metallo-hydrolase [Halorubrum sp. CBA1125]
MVHSTWGDTFLKQEIEATTPDCLTVWYLGCNGFVLRSPEATIYVDPYFGDGDPPTWYRMIPVPLDPEDVTACDAVLATHEHVDHFNPDSYGPMVEDLGADLYASSTCFESPQIDYPDLRAPKSRRQIVEPGASFDIGDLTVHVRESNDPDAAGDVSYVVEHETGTFFTAGDSRVADAFDEIGSEFDIDLGALAFGTHARIFYTGDWITEDEEPHAEPGKMYMDENDVVESANALQLNRLVPCHFDMWKGGLADAKSIHEHMASFAYPRVLEVAEVGDRLTVREPGIEPMRNLGEH